MTDEGQSRKIIVFLLFFNASHIILYSSPSLSLQLSSFRLYHKDTLTDIRLTLKVIRS